MTNRPYNNKPYHTEETIRLGAISFVNTIPIYSNYKPAPQTRLVYEVPARLNAMMRQSELEISPVSSACYLRNRDQFILLDDLSVSSPGAVESVLFLSRVPLGPKMLDAAFINIPNDSETSVMLLAHLLEEATGQNLQPWFRTYEAGNYQQVLRETGNALIIGDNALLMKESLSDESAHYYCYDLSSLWKEKTGLPFVFAVWVANRNWAEKYPEQLHQVNRALIEARNGFFNSLHAFQAGLAKAQQRSALPESTLERYYRQCLTYGLSQAHHNALKQFDAILQQADQRPEQQAKNRESQPVER